MNYDLKKIELVEKYNRVSTQYLVYYDGEDKINVTLENVDMPFGIELYLGKYISNLEIEENRSNELYNIVQNMKQIDNWARKLSDSEKEFCEKNFFPSFKNKLLRTHVHKDLIIYRNNKDVTVKIFDKIKKGCDDLHLYTKGLNAHLTLDSIWINEKSYGFNWQLTRLDISKK